MLLVIPTKQGREMGISFKLNVRKIQYNNIITYLEIIILNILWVAVVAVVIR